MDKKSALDLFEHYYQGLISLPLKDNNFMEDLFKHDLLSENIKHRLETFNECKDRTSYFLDNIIKATLAVGDKRCFGDLLTVMNKYDNVKDLATQIKSEYYVDAKCELMIYITICDQPCDKQPYEHKLC